MRHLHGFYMSTLEKGQAKKHCGRRNILWEKCPVGELLYWRDVRSGKPPSVKCSESRHLKEV